LLSVKFQGYHGQAWGVTFSKFTGLPCVNYIKLLSYFTKIT
jgi:hypothetical protein